MPPPRASAPMSALPPERRLLVFGRLPEAGRAKTRLAPALGEEEAAELYSAFLDDAVKGATGTAPVELWVPERPDAVSSLERRYPGVRVRLQPEGSLGERLETAFEAAFGDGADYAVAVGSDHPTLPPDMLPRAFRALRGAHLVLGPSRDGGYYAIGIRRHAWPRAAGLFRGAPWSDPGLLSWTRARASELDLCHVELPAWYDVDRPEDLERMEADLSPGTATAVAWARLRPVGAGEGG
ncbi:MAG: TIGR04282 family arsenosugar biosynthesis glycosyltransferase [Gemmatimonadota bacterium]|nr:TIGR04282 family arsenosugar biosynthesis glycosyltransferase [Gemmatimonadota bacterium]